MQKSKKETKSWKFNAQNVKVIQFKFQEWVGCFVMIVGIFSNMKKILVKKGSKNLRLKSYWTTLKREYFNEPIVPTAILFLYILGICGLLANLNFKSLLAALICTVLIILYIGHIWLCVREGDEMIRQTGDRRHER